MWVQCLFTKDPQQQEIGHLLHIRLLWVSKTLYDTHLYIVTNVFNQKSTYFSVFFIKQPAEVIAKLGVLIQSSV